MEKYVYNVYIDIIYDETEVEDDDMDVDVYQTSVEALNAENARDIIESRIEHGDLADIIQGRDFYVWEITEEDVNTRM